MPAFVRRPDIAADTADAICSLAGEIPGFVHRIAGRRDPGSHLDALAGSDDVASDHRTCLSGAMLAARAGARAPPSRPDQAVGRGPLTRTDSGPARYKVRSCTGAVAAIIASSWTVLD
jgi:hypothetical protein